MEKILDDDMVQEIMNEIIKNPVFCSEADFKYRFAKIAETKLKEKVKKRSDAKLGVKADSDAASADKFKIYMEYGIHSMLFLHKSDTNFNPLDIQWAGDVKFDIDRAHLDIVICIDNDDELGIEKQVVSFEFKYKVLVPENGGGNYCRYNDGCDIDSCRIFEIKSPGAQPYNKYLYVKDIYKLENILKYANGSADVGYAIFLTNDEKYWNDIAGLNGAAGNFIIDDDTKLARGCHRWNRKKKNNPLEDAYPAMSLGCDYDIKWSDEPPKDADLLDKYRYLIVKVDESEVQN